MTQDYNAAGITDSCGDFFCYTLGTTNNEKTLADILPGFELHT